MPRIETTSRQSRDLARRLSGRRGMPRAVAAALAGLFLIGVAYETSFAFSRADSVLLETHKPKHKRKKGNYGGRGGIPAGAAVGLAAGGALGIAAATGVLGGAAAAGGGIAGIAAGAPALIPGEGATIAAPLPADCVEHVKKIRVFPLATEIKAGQCFRFDVQAFCKRQNEKRGLWYSLLAAPERAREVTLDTLYPDPCLVKQEGKDNVFCVPIGAPQSCNGRTVRLIGTWAPPGRTPLSAESVVTVLVPGEGAGPSKPIE